MGLLNPRLGPGTVPLLLNSIGKVSHKVQNRSGKKEQSRNHSGSACLKFVSLSQFHTTGNIPCTRDEIPLSVPPLS